MQFNIARSCYKYLAEFILLENKSEISLKSPLQKFNKWLY